MALYAISDFHLSFGTDKPMDIFKGWANYTERLKENIEKTGAGLLFQNRNVEDLKEKLLALLAQDVSMMKEKELECYKKNYQTSLIKDKLLEIYQK